jgi:PST family polysaccharide transporter
LNLARTSFYSAVSTFITLLSGFIITKVVSIEVGPEGMAYVGQFQNISAILSIIASGAISVGIIKYLAEYGQNSMQQQKTITSALYIILVLSLITSVIVIANTKQLSAISFHTTELQQVYFLYGFFLTVISLNIWFTAVFNGLKEIKKLTIVNIAGALAGIFFTIYFAKTMGIKGVLIAGNFTAAVTLLFNIYFTRQLKTISWKPQPANWDPKYINLFFGFTLMSITAIFSDSMAQIFVRDRIITQLSITEAGVWQGITRLSDYYLGFIVTVLSVYYLPRLSEITDKIELRYEILKGYRMIIPVVTLLALLIFVFKSYIIQILFTRDFIGMLPLFKFQLIGDVLKIGSWIIAFIMLARRLVKTFIVTEIVFAITYVGLSYFFIDKYGVIGSTYAFALNYALYWITVGILMRKYLK